MSPPVWQRPNPYGFPAAMESAGAIASPLLAGFSLTLVGIVLGTAEALRWPNAALVLLVGAIALLIGSVQCAYWARQYAVTPAELQDWWPSLYSDPERLHEVRGEQLAHRRLHDIWVGRFAYAYHGGILLMLGALAVLLVPRDAIGLARGVALAVALTAVVGELIWIAASVRRGPRMLSRAREWLVPSLRWIDPGSEPEITAQHKGDSGSELDRAAP